MPCEVVPLRVDFFKMTKMLKKNEKHKNDHPLFGVNLTLFAPWLPLQRPPF
jgi:hypothetical protein